MTPDFFSLSHPQVWVRNSKGVLPGREASLAWQSRAENSLGERQERDKKAWVSGLLEELRPRHILERLIPSGQHLALG